MDADSKQYYEAQYIVKIGDEIVSTFEGTIESDPELSVYENIEQARCQAEEALTKTYAVYRENKIFELTSENIAVTLAIKAPNGSEVSCTDNQQQQNEKLAMVAWHLSQNLGDRLDDDFCSYGDTPKTWEEAFNNDSYFQPDDRNAQRDNPDDDIA
jgi:hypothetical protein